MPRPFSCLAHRDWVRLERQKATGAAALTSWRPAGRLLNSPRDLTAEVFAAALVAASRFEPGGSAEAWLYGIARRTLAPSRRRVGSRLAPALVSGWRPWT